MGELVFKNFLCSPRLYNIANQCLAACRMTDIKYSNNDILLLAFGIVCHFDLWTQCHKAIVMAF